MLIEARFAGRDMWINDADGVLKYMLEVAGE